MTIIILRVDLLSTPFIIIYKYFINKKYIKEEVSLVFSITKTKEKYISNIYEFTADYESDIKDLPTDRNEIRAGSTCICLGLDSENGASVWKLGNDYVWHKI